MKEPKIRFKGFQGEWEETSLGKLSTNYKYGINAAAIPYDGTNKYLRITDIDENTRMFSQEDLTSPGTDLSCCNEYLLEEGDITIARTGASVGKSYIYHLSDGKVYFAGFLIRTRLNENVDKDYVFYSTLTDKYAKYIRLVSQRSGQPGVNVEELKGYTFNIPCDKAEQCNIASYFQHLDSLIQSNTKKIESLKQVKAASLQSMFPQEGETTPRVRFKGFEGEWEKVKLGDICEKVVRKAKPDTKAPVMMISAANGFVNQSEKYASDNAGKSLDNYTLILKGEICYNHGYSKIRNFGSCFCLQLLEARVPFVYHSFKPYNDDSVYLAIYLNSGIIDGELKKRVSSTARMDGLLNISYDSYMTTLIKIPSIAEQRAIASYFTSLDRQINFHTQRLEKLKQIKVACLDKMFV